jgi:hypothetical protein
MSIQFNRRFIIIKTAGIMTITIMGIFAICCILVIGIPIVIIQAPIEYILTRKINNVKCMFQFLQIVQEETQNHMTQILS